MRSSRLQEGGHRPPPRGGFISRGVNAVVGLTAEAVASRKNNKAGPTTYSDQITAPPSYEQSDHGQLNQMPVDAIPAAEDKGMRGDDPSATDSDYDEEIDLDEVTQDLPNNNRQGVRKPPPTGNIVSPAAIKTLVESFVAHFPPPQTPVGVLERPVILPQRRPGNKRRGFVQAYAPMLEQAGIAQDAFLSFGEYFEQSIKVSPIFDIINLAANIVGFVPLMSAQIASTVAWIVDITAQEMYRRNRTNDFLVQMNDQYFKPHGLFCMIVVYKPEEPENFNETIDINTGSVQKRETPLPEQTRTGRFRLASSETKGETQMPEPAPLIFPQLDQWAEQGGSPYKPETAGFLRNYLDRRAQANFNHRNPNAIISSDTSFATKWADPSYQSQFAGRPSRMLIGAVTNSGPSQLTTSRLEYRSTRAERRQARRAARGPRLSGLVMDGVQQLATGRKPGPGTSGQRPLQRIRQGLREDVLYLIVVPLPDAEMRKEVEKVVGESGIGEGFKEGQKM